MRRISAGFILLIAASAAFSLGKPVPQPSPSREGVLVIEDFESGNFNKKDTSWWVFDNLSAKLAPGKDSRYSLELKGNARDWYVGGIGKYIGQDVGKFNSFDMDVYGAGKESGVLKIELYDDDNGNWQIEQDPKKGYAPIYDDRYVYELKVDWNGYKHVSIPISEFLDNNPEAGDNVWNPQQIGGSGGLLQMQIVANAVSKTGKVNMRIENIEFRETRGKKL